MDVQLGVQLREIDGNFCSVKRCLGVLTVCILFRLGASLPTQFPRVGEFFVAFVEDHLLSSSEHVLGSNVTDGAVESHRVIVLDVVGDDSSGVIQGQRHRRANAFALECTMPTFDFAVGLRIVG